MKTASFVLAILSLIGCNQRQIKVVDENNIPLAGAEISYLAPSMESATNHTDSNGIAPVPKIVGGFMLRINLTGFETILINTSSDIPTSITLRKSL